MEGALGQLGEDGAVGGPANALQADGAGAVQQARELVHVDADVLAGVGGGAAVNGEVHEAVGGVLLGERLDGAGLADVALLDRHAVPD